MPSRLAFLFDENIGVSVVDHFVAQGFDVRAIVREKSLRGATDRDVLALAVREDRILVTCDKDFAELVFHSGLEHRGVILLRLRALLPAHQVKALGTVFSELAQIPPAMFITITDTEVRIR